jgi:hypothetical protein
MILVPLFTPYACTLYAITSQVISSLLYTQPTYIILLAVVEIGNVNPIGRKYPEPEEAQVKALGVPLSLIRITIFLPLVGEPVVEALNVNPAARAVNTYWSYNEGSIVIEVADAWVLILGTFGTDQYEPAEPLAVNTPVISRLATDIDWPLANPPEPPPDPADPAYPTTVLAEPTYPRSPFDPAYPTPDDPAYPALADPAYPATVLADPAYPATVLADPT